MSTLTDQAAKDLALLSIAWATAKTQQLETENGTASSGPVDDMQIDVERAYWACARHGATVDQFIAQPQSSVPVVLSPPTATTLAPRHKTCVIPLTHRVIPQSRARGIMNEWSLYED